MLNDPLPLVVAALVAFIAGTVRGFAGFGAAMLMTPVLAALFGPTPGVTLCLLLEFAVGLPLLRRSVQLVNWRRIGLLLAAATVAVPVGTWLLLNSEPAPLRWAISAIVLAAVLLLASGWRFPGTPGHATTLGAGVLSGFLNGLSGMAGPPIAFYYLAGRDPPAVVRASLTTYFVFVDAVAVISLAVRGEVSSEILLTGALLVPAVILGGLLGERLFPLASGRFYRRLALVLLTTVAIGSAFAA
jgi:uncharacterized membrane protein YfcA